MPAARSPVVRRRELGVLLRTLRTDAGMTVEDVAKALLCSPSKVSRMETAQRAASQRDIRDLCDLYQVPDSQREHLIALAKARPGKLNFGTTGYGSLVHLVAEVLMKETGIRMQQVPYKSGTNSIADLLSGEPRGACASDSV